MQFEDLESDGTSQTFEERFKAALTKAPPLHEVEKDLAKLEEIRKSGGPRRYITAELEKKPSVDTPTLKELSEVHATDTQLYTTLLPSLRQYCIWAHFFDVPQNLRSTVIWCLERFVRGLTIDYEEAFEVAFVSSLDFDMEIELQQFHKELFVLYVWLEGARCALVHALSDDNIRRGPEILPYIKDMIETELHWKSDFGKRLLPSGGIPITIWGPYADELVHARDYAEACTACERIIEIADENEASHPRYQMIAVRARIHLALIYKELGTNSASQKKYTDWSVAWLKKYPAWLPKHTIKTMFELGDVSHPVLEALGGERWLKTVMSLTTISTPKKLERAGKMCRACGVYEFRKPLFRCSKCQTAYYCSKECQKSSWQDHRITCSDGSKDITDILERRGAPNNPKVSKFKKDWLSWHEKPQPERTKLAMALALGMHRDPTRARTRAFVQEVAYVPHERDPRHRFRAARAGVFLLADIMEKMDRMTGKDGGRAIDRVEAFWREDRLKTAQRDSLSVVIVTYEPQIGTYRIDVVYTSLEELKDAAAEIDWRNVVGHSTPATPMRTFLGAREVNDVFE